MSRWLILAVLAANLGATCPAMAAETDRLLILPALFSDGAVFPADRPVVVWGQSLRRAKLRVTLGQDEVKTRADEDGHWQVELPAHPADAAGQSFEMRIAAQRGSQRVIRSLHNLVFGDLWLCAGQSNMQRSIHDTDHAADAAAAADDPLLRILVMPERSLNEPTRHFDGQWLIVDREHIADLPAVAVYFGQALRHSVDRPLGLIVAAAPSSRCEAWIEADRLRSDSRFDALFAAAEALLQSHHQTDETAATQSDVNAESTREDIGNMTLDRRHAPGLLFNGMIEPLRGLALRGVIWYQGESNVRQPQLYAPLLSNLIADWRAFFADPDLPFGIVQLPAYQTKPEELAGDPQLDHWAQLRQAQRQVSLQTPHVGMIVTLDLGDGQTRHPTLKQPVGRRLAGWALSQVYGQTTTAYPGLQPLRAVRHGDQVRVTFQRTVAAPVTRDGQPPRMFELLDADHHVAQVKATLDAQDALLDVPPDFQPTQVRYAWTNYPAQANLSDAAGLPCTPFELPIEDHD